MLLNLVLTQQPTCLQQNQKYGSSSKMHEDHFRNNKQIQILNIEIDINKSMLTKLIVDKNIGPFLLWLAIDPETCPH